MLNNSISVNPQMKLQIIPVGNEKTPIMIIDDFALNTDNIIYDACNNANFKTDKQSFYPGIRALLPRQYTIDVLQAIYRTIAKVYKIPEQLKLVPQDTFYSLISKQENELSLLQCLPHFDTSKRFYFAVLHYLNGQEHGDTGLFRHKPTGFERINENRVETYLKSANEYVSNIERPDKKYITQSSAQYELYHTIKYIPNRLVIYPGNLLHSTIVLPEKDIDADPRTGRLTANIFIEFK